MPTTGHEPRGAVEDHLHVVAAVVEHRGLVLIALRSEDRHQGGLWEFPGGKREDGESVRDALTRELNEELGINVVAARPLIQVRHSYPDRNVFLDVWRVDAFSGEPHGKEGQPIRWVERWPEFLSRLERSLASSGVRLVQFRAKELGAGDYEELAGRVLERVHAAGAQVLLNADPSLVSELGADGVHLSSARLWQLSERPLGHDHWVGASCHTHEELQRAAAIDCDFALLSPVSATVSHPQTPPLGWERLRELTSEASVPVYALGGLGNEQLPVAWENGAQGIAAIRAFWEADT